MKTCIRKSVETIFWSSLIFLVIFGVLLNLKLRVRVDKVSYEDVLSLAEIDYIESIFAGEHINFEEIEKTFLAKLERVISEPNSPKKQYELGEIYYILGVNSYKRENYIDARHYLGLSKDALKHKNNYYYILNINNMLMNIAYYNLNYIEGVNLGSEIYEILENQDIKGISKLEQTEIEVNALTGLINITSTIQMVNISEKYYLELLEITKNPKFENDITINAKYNYNLNMENYESAIKYANEYIDYIKKNNPEDDKYIDAAHLYLLEAKIESGKFENIDDLFNKVENAYKDIDYDKEHANVHKLMGMYNMQVESYDKAFYNFNKALEFFENVNDKKSIAFVSGEIIKLNSKVDMNIDKYLAKIGDNSDQVDKEEFMGKLADSITKASHQRSNEETVQIWEQFEVKKEVNNIIEKINIIYLFIIILLIFIGLKLKLEIKQRRQKERELEYMVRIDYLTKSYSKQFIFEKINCYKLKNEAFIMVIFDLDNFKCINDTYGHTFGDEVLVKVVSCVKKVIKKNGCIGRFGGEEFIIILNKETDVKRIIENIDVELNNLELSLKEVKVTVSGGAMRWDGRAIKSLIQETDKLLYRAKFEGKNKIIVGKV